MTAAAKPLAGEQRSSANAEHELTIAAAELNQALTSIDRMIALARVIQGLLPNGSDSDETEAVVDALVDVAVLSSNRVHDAIQRLGERQSLPDSADVTEGTHASTAETTRPIGKQPVAAARVDVALQAVHEIAALSHGLDKYGDAEVPPAVMRLFVHRIYRLACAVMSAIGDELESAESVAARTFAKTCIRSEAVHG